MRLADLEDAYIEHKPCRHVRTIRRFLCDKHGLTQADFELILELDGLKTFRHQDFASGELTMGKDKYRWKRLHCPKTKDRWVYTFRTRRPPFENYNLYALTPKAKAMCKEFYKCCVDITRITPKKYSKKNRHTVNKTIGKINKLKKEAKKKF